VFACPPAFTVYQPLLGMGIGHASQTFFFTAGFSMFSKVMGVRNNGARVATMASFAAMGSTLGSLIGGRYTMSIYGTWWFYLTLVPSGIALLLLLTPRFWERLHPLHYITKQVNDAWENDMKKQVAVW
jgi:MFS family permease